MLFNGVRKIFEENGVKYHVNNVCSIGSIFFNENPVTDYTSSKASDTAAFAKYFKYMLGHGIHLAPSQFEALFVSDSHTEKEIGEFLDLIRGYFAK